MRERCGCVQGKSYWPAAQEALAFVNNDLPGVMLSSAAVTYAQRYAESSVAGCWSPTTTPVCAQRLRCWTLGW